MIAEKFCVRFAKLNKEIVPNKKKHLLQILQPLHYCLFEVQGLIQKNSKEKAKMFVLFLREIYLYFLLWDFCSNSYFQFPSKIHVTCFLICTSFNWHSLLPIHQFVNSLFFCFIYSIYYFLFLSYFCAKSANKQMEN